MRKKTVCRFLLPVCILSCLVCRAAAQPGDSGMREKMTQSLVYLNISSYPFDQLRPWKFTDVQQKRGLGCAVGRFDIITTAWNLTGARLIKVYRFGQNEFIPATIKIIDYETNLALLHLDPNALAEPLIPVKFVEKFRRGAKLNYYWLSKQGNLETGQGYLDRARVRRSTVSFAYLLNYIVTNTSSETGSGQFYCDGRTPIGIACWSSGTKQAALVPAVTINNFLADARDGDYHSVPVAGFTTTELIDPAVRSFLKMPPTIKDGCLVTDVHTLGTGRNLLRAKDVILAIDGRQIDAHSRFLHPLYSRIFFHHLLGTHKIGDNIKFDIWRDGTRRKVDVKAENFSAQQMLIPYYEYDRRPEYIVTGGFVFQRLTRPYLTSWGHGWAGKVTPHLYHYYRDLAFKPTDERRDIVILSYVLPAQINLGYKDLGRLVVKNFNGMKIHSIADILTAQKLDPGSKYDVVEFELDNPEVVIPREQLPAADILIGRSYGIRKLVNVNP